MILPLPRTGPSSRCRLQLTTKVRLSRPSRAATWSAPSDSGSSVSPSPRNAQTREFGGVEQAAVVEVAVVAGLVDGADRPEAHRDRRELPELRHEPRVRVRAEARRRGRSRAGSGRAGRRSGGPRGTPGRRCPARRGPGRRSGRPVPPASLPRKKWLKPTSYRVAAEAYVARWPPIPENWLFARRTIATAFQRMSRRMRRSIASSPGNVGLLLGADRVDVAGLGQRRQPDLELARPLEELVDDEPGAGLAFLGDDLVERREPVLGLVRVDVGQLVLELVEIHACRQRSPSRVAGRRLRVGIGVRPIGPTAMRLQRVLQLGAAVGRQAVASMLWPILEIRHPTASCPDQDDVSGDRPSPCHRPGGGREHPAARARRRRRAPDHEARLDRPRRGGLPRRHRRRRRGGPRKGRGGPAGHRPARHRHARPRRHRGHAPAARAAPGRRSSC